jgi:hypothetical protein
MARGHEVPLSIQYTTWRRFAGVTFGTLKTTADEKTLRIEATHSSEHPRPSMSLVGGYNPTVVS